MTNDSENVELSSSDIEAFVNFIIPLMAMGMCEIRLHPCRFGLILRALVRHQMVEAPLQAADSGQEVIIPLEINTPTGGRLVAHLIEWKPCDKADCKDCKTLADNEQHYPGPAPEAPSSPLWTPPGS